MEHPALTKDSTELMYWMHDYYGAIEFVERCVKAVRAALPFARIETRMDGAFFSMAMTGKLEELGVEYAISVPFERFCEL